MALFYAPDIELGNELSPQESLHCIKVMRLTAGDEIELFDGKGFFYNAVITDANYKKCRFRIISKSKKKEFSYFAHIAMAPAKSNDRTAWFIEKAVEVGIAGVGFIRSEHSERKTLNDDRVSKIVVSAMKQSGKASLPKLKSITTFTEWIGSSFDGQKFICHCGEGEKSDLYSSVIPGKPVLILIGPEGDFSPGEVQLAMENGFVPVTMGPEVLRTETAALVATLTVKLKNQNSK